ncbi:MAG: adenine phosphoribosyltransferase [Myxococcota bacterium]
MSGVSDLLRSKIADVPDFPKPGILFKDITPVLAHGPTLARVVDAFAERYARLKVDAVAGIESRGFLFAIPLALRLGIGAVLVRKPGKLPRNTHERSYELEYGTDRLQVHQEDLQAGQRVVVIDDLLATGGTMSAATELVRHAGADPIEAAFMVELSFLKGRTKLSVPSFSLVEY